MSTQEFIFSNPSPDTTPIIPEKKKEIMVVVILSLWYGEIMLYKVERYQKVIQL
jgi:hypothetical protein